MAKLTWDLPFSYDDFAAGATATTWGFHDTAPITLSMQFNAAQPAWTTETYWSPAEMAFNEAQVGGPVSISADDPATGSDSAAVLAAPDGSDLGAAGDTAGVGVFATASDQATGGDTGTVTALLVGGDTATGADATSVLAIVSPADTGSGLDEASLLVQAHPDDPGMGDDLAQISAAATADELIPVSDDLAIAATLATTSDDATASDAAEVTVFVEINAADDAFAEDAAEVNESIPTPSYPSVGTGPMSPRRRRQVADLSEGAKALDDAAVLARLRGRDEVKVWDVAGVKKWPDPRYANPVILAMMMAAIDDA